MQKIQLDLTNHPVKNLLSDKVRLGKIEIIRDSKSEEEQISIDFTMFQDAAEDPHSRKGSIIAAPVFHNMN